MPYGVNNCGLPIKITVIYLTLFHIIVIIGIVNFLTKKVKLQKRIGKWEK